MSFTPIDPSDPWAGFGRMGAAAGPLFPDNGTAFLQADFAETIKFSSINASLFSLLAVDLAEYSTVLPDAHTVRFVGYRYDGSVITAEFTTDGVIDGTGPLADFETFHFGPEWNGLTRVEIPTPLWSLDNLVVAIPEPSSAALLGLGAAVFALARRPRSGAAPRSPVRPLALAPALPARHQSVKEVRTDLFPECPC